MGERMTATTPHLPSDYSRCKGWDDEHACTTCLRRLVIPQDDPLRVYPYKYSGINFQA